MAEISNIEWTDATWNPWHGCHKVSAGCKNCYMFREKKQYGQDPNTVVRSKTKFYDPLKWKEPRRIFTCSWSDFFIEEADAWRDEAFEIMSKTPQHTYQILTKRPDRMLDYISRSAYLTNAPLRNVWLGVSVEDQKTADARIPLLLETPAAIRFLSIEPLLGPVDLRPLIAGTREESVSWLEDGCAEDRIDWVIVGGESGPRARPMHPDWVRSLRDQCTEVGTPFFFKQWGEWYSGPRISTTGPYRICRGGTVEGTEFAEHPDSFFMVGAETVVQKLGKKRAGRILDGRTWDEMPEVSR